MYHSINYCVDKQLVLVNYPGSVKNDTNVLKSLGGLNAISEAFSQQQKLELKYHPRNPYNKVVNSDVVQSAGLLLRIKVKVLKKSVKKDSTKKIIDILGYTSIVYNFDSLCDFQYIPCLTGDKNESLWYINLLKSRKPMALLNASQNNVLLQCSPHVFARCDSVYVNIHRNDLTDNDQSQVLGAIQKPASDSRSVVLFNLTDVFPSQPDSQIVKRLKVKFVSDDQLNKIQQLFNKCPIWTRIALLYESGMTNEKLKCILPSVAYNFPTGPWRTLYVKYGYDPRRHYESRYYQTFDFRLRFRTGVSEYVNVHKINKKKKSINKLVQDIDYPYFEEDKLPRSRQCIFRYCDIKVPKIQEMLNNVGSPLTGAKCNEKTGWLPNGFDAQVRLFISNLIKELIRTYYPPEQISQQEPLDKHTDDPTNSDDVMDLDSSYISEE